MISIWDAIIQETPSIVLVHANLFQQQKARHRRLTNMPHAPVSKLGDTTNESPWEKRTSVQDTGTQKTIHFAAVCLR
jgi:hypothetical protein